MSEEQKEAKPKKRMTATQAAASIGPMVKEFITDAIRARASDPWSKNLLPMPSGHGQRENKN
ncbi:MAG: hypothetical protein ACXWM6_12450 [Thermodesulfobacteriota bacterium]